MLKFRSAQEWILYCKATVRRDMDNLVLFTGEEGAGKSTWMFQVGKQLDPTYGVDRIYFDMMEWMGAAPGVPRYGVRHLDELFGSGRMAMRRENLELNKHLQICRQFNQHMLVAFPRARRLDQTIVERVRWRWDVPRRGMAVLYYLKKKERVSQTKGEVVTFRWSEVMRCGFRANRGPEWEAYLAKKNTEGAAASFGVIDVEGSDEDDLDSTAGVDVRDAIDFFSARLRVHQERAGPGASINETP